LTDGLKGILFRELSVFRTRLGRQVLSSSVSPLLFLIAFGWGFGRDVTVNGVSYIAFLIPGLITMNSLNQSYGIAQEININRFYFHVFDEYLIAPVRSVEIVLGEALYGMFKGVLSTVIIFVFALLFRVDLVFHPGFVPALLLHTFVFSCLGVTVAMVVRDHASQTSVTTFVITPMIFLCGTFFPVESFPDAVKAVVQLLPLTHSTGIIRATLTGTAVPVGSVGVLALFAAGFFGTALAAVRRVEA